MRQIATSRDEAAVRKFCDYLLTLKIATRLLPEADGTGLWVCDEDKVDLAAQEYQRFLEEPGDPRFDQAPAAAREIRRTEERKEKDYRARTTRLRDRMDGSPTAADRPLTIALIVIAVLVTLGSNFGNAESAITQALIDRAVRGGRQADRLARPGRRSRRGRCGASLTPIFLHFDILHLVFNAMMMLSLGGRVEASRGTAALPRAGGGHSRSPRTSANTTSSGTSTRTRR